ncbi:MOSC domain-containing protein [Sphingorhabdus sp. YGSMI21]|uniref:MOSC domain-containing protein n=1 Tax=Sphingorhabdus sp. YGSMI21 TaxID=2077182 RepID=UPI000C1F6514|nr:MOSC domain-containing protein [Sphingorhabdus sp. YGSMI21]ATW04620.1 MOSC domain-containing protein [Sphingorhabdus sp. YGSMI21]
MISTRLDQLMIGTPQKFRDDGAMSAIAKHPVEDALILGLEGLAGNQVADPLHHGGRDKAVHLYPAEHYGFWRDKYPDLHLLEQPGAFGENFSCTGMTEDRLCLGDIFRLGEALIQCSHARKPCWKLNHRFGKPDVLKTVVKTGKSGSYFRVLETGKVQAGDLFFQQERPLPDWPLDRLFDLIIGGQHKGRSAELRILAENPLLAENWRQRAQQLAETQTD